jgi:hypothetical protein
VVDSRAESHLGRLEGILRGEVNVQKEDASFVGGPGRPEDSGNPFVEVVSFRSGTELFKKKVKIYLH